MKIVYLFFCFISVISSDCNQSPSAKSNSNQSVAVAAANTEMQENSTFQKRLGDIEYTFTTRLVKKGLHDGINYENDYLYIDYKVRNSGSKNYLVFNRGHDDRDDKTLVYVEAQADGSVEISQKAFVEPSRKVCPTRDAPITPRASWLKAKQTIREQVGVALPLKSNTPFDDCAPQTAMPASINQTRFCLGIVEVDVKTVRLDKSGNISGWHNSAGQKLLCSDLIELK